MIGKLHCVYIKFDIFKRNWTRNLSITKPSKLISRLSENLGYSLCNWPFSAPTDKIPRCVCTGYDKPCKLERLIYYDCETLSNVRVNIKIIFNFRIYIYIYINKNYIQPLLKQIWKICVTPITLHLS